MLRKYLPDLLRRSPEVSRPASFADLMEDFWKSPTEGFPFKGLSYPALDVSETDSEVVVKAELPGIEPKEVQVTLDRGVLSIRGEKKFEEEEKDEKRNYHRIERSYGAFARSVTLPAEVQEDKVKARFDKGVLTITMPKSEKSKSRTIAIES